MSARRASRQLGFAICALCSGIALDVRVLQAQTSELDRDAVGFGDAAPVAVAPPASDTSEPSAWSLAASLRFRAAVRVETATPSRFGNLLQIVQPRLEWREHFGAVSLYARASVRTEVDFAYLWDPAVHDAATQETYAWQIIAGESYAALSTGPFELSVGEQIANWGQGEVLSVLDVVSPRDLREPLLTDAGDVRIPVLMTRAKLASEHLGAEAVIVHEPYFGLLPPPLGEFSPFRKLLLSNPLVAAALDGRTVRYEMVPPHDVTDLGATQALGRVTWSGTGVDLALLAGTILDGLGVPTLPGPEALASQAIAFPMLHPRYTLLGHSGAFTFGAFVLRWEAAFEVQRALAVRQPDRALQLSALRRNDIRGLLGLTYAPSATTSAALELVQSYVFENPERDPESNLVPLFPVEATQLALRANHRFFRERASASLLVLLVGLTDFNACVGRVELGYNLLDSLEVSLGYLMYLPSNDFGYFYGFDLHDRLFFNVRWDVST